MSIPRNIWSIYFYYRTEPSRLVLREWCVQLLRGCVRHCHSAYATFPLLSPEIENFIKVPIIEKILLELNISYCFLKIICGTLSLVEHCFMVFPCYFTITPTY